MNVLDRHAPVLHLAEGSAAWVLFLVGIACALVLGGAYLSRLWRSDGHVEGIRHQPAAPGPFRNQRDERVAGG